MQLRSLHLDSGSLPGLVVAIRVDAGATLLAAVEFLALGKTVWADDVQDQKTVQDSRV